MLPLVLLPYIRLPRGLMGLSGVGNGDVEGPEAHAAAEKKTPARNRETLRADIGFSSFECRLLLCPVRNESRPNRPRFARLKAAESISKECGEGVRGWFARSGNRRARCA